MSATPVGPKGRAEDQTTYLAGSAITIHRGIKRGADAKTAVPATANSLNVGCAADNQDSVGRGFPAYTKPGALIHGEVGAAVALDALLTTDANARFVTATSGQNVCAIAREVATAISQIITIEWAASGRLAP